jgi:hypothetical protein
VQPFFIGKSMATRSKNADTERLDSTHIERVIELLEPKEGKPGTKKDACQILGIAYNTTRLGNIIEKYKADKERDAQKRAEKRGKPATSAEITYVIQSYLEGNTIESISNALFRPSNFINGILDNYAVPKRQSAHSYFRPELVPEEAMRDRFTVGEKVYSMRYDSLASIESEWKPGIYAIWLISDRWKQYAYQEASELASLEHLKKLGVDL